MNEREPSDLISEQIEIIGEVEFLQLTPEYVRRLVDVRIESCDPIDLELLSPAEHLKRLVIIKTPIKNNDLSPLTSCSQLHTLSLYRNDIPELDLSPLESCSYLHELHIRYNKLLELDLEPLRFCSQLKTLDVSVNSLDSISLEPLSYCHQIEKISLRHNALVEVDLLPLHSCCRLHVLDIDYNKLTEFDLTPLNSCTQLQELSLIGNEIEMLDLTPLSSCSELTDLSIGSNRLQEIDLTPLSFCSNIHAIHLSNNQLTGIDLSPLSSCRDLTHLLSDMPTLTYIDLRPLKSCHKLHYVTVHYLCTVQIHHTQISACNDRVKQFDLDFKQALLDPDFDMRELSVWVHYNGSYWDERLEFINEILDEEFYSDHVKELQAYLDREGSTALLDIETIRRSAAVILIPQIIELREREPQIILAYEPEKFYISKHKIYDLTPILGTHIIELILRKGGIEPSVDILELEEIQQMLQEMGIPVEWEIVDRGW